MTLVGPGTWEAARAAVDAASPRSTWCVAGAPQRVRAVPAAGPSRDARGVRRVVLPQQRGGRREALRGAGHDAGGRRRHRRAPRQRHAGDVLRPRRRALRLDSMSTRAPAGSRTTRATRTRPARAQVAAGTSTCPCPGHRRRSLARGASRGWRQLSGRTEHRPGRLARRRRGSRRPGEPAAGHRLTGTPSRSAPARTWACRRSSSRRAAITWPLSAISWWPRWPRSKADPGLRLAGRFDPGLRPVAKQPQQEISSAGPQATRSGAPRVQPRTRLRTRDRISLRRRVRPEPVAGRRAVPGLPRRQGLRRPRVVGLLRGLPAGRRDAAHCQAPAGR